MHIFRKHTFKKQINQLGFSAIALGVGLLMPVTGWIQSSALYAQPAEPTVAPAVPTPNSPATLQNPQVVKADVPYIATPEAVVTQMLKLADVKRRDIVYDLGSGDGRVVIAAVRQFGARRGIGVEINPDLIQKSQSNALQAGVGDRVQFVQKDLFQADFKDASVVTLYLLPEVNLKLRPRLLRELKPGTRIVSHAFTMGDWKPDKVFSVPGETPERVLYYWVVPANIAGNWQGTLTYAPSRSKAYTFEFTQQFQQVKGNVIVDGQKYAMTNLSLTGDRLTFNRTETIEGQTVTLVFNGQVEGDTLKGVAELQAGFLSRSFPIVAQRSSTPEATNP